MFWNQAPVFRFQSYHLLAVTLYRLPSLSAFQLRHFYHGDINTISSTLLALKFKYKTLRRLVHTVSTQRLLGAIINASKIIHISYTYQHIYYSQQTKAGGLDFSIAVAYWPICAYTQKHACFLGILQRFILKSLQNNNNKVNTSNYIYIYIYLF